jgi:AmiR/NasT family two-component response regulator/ATP-dependent Clp protease adapter protein ClpS
VARCDLSLADSGGLSGLVFKGEVEVIVVRFDADHLVVESCGCDSVQEDLDAVALDDLVVVVERLGGLFDLELHLALGLRAGDTNRPEIPERIERAFVDLQHRASLCIVRILIAEDETIIRLDLRDLLERAGHEVVAEARDGEEAVALAREHEPDLAILDVRMPHLDGIEAAKTILADRPIPIVMLTAYGQDELVARAVEAGVFGYLVKPFREQDLVPAIATARARHQELAAVREEAESLGEALAARKAIERAKGLLRRVRPASQGEPGVGAAAEGDCRGRDRYARSGMSTYTPPKERIRRSTGSGTGDAWRVIVLNDNHNTFEGVAFALAQTIPGVDYDRGMALANRIHTSGQALVWSGHRELAELYHSQLEGYGLTLAPLER